MLNIEIFNLLSIIDSSIQYLMKSYFTSEVRAEERKMIDHRRKEEEQHKEQLRLREQVILTSDWLNHWNTNLWLVESLQY